MAVYRPKYRDLKTGAAVQSDVWWFEFTFAGKRIRESAKTTRKTIAAEAEKRRRLELEKALAGIPADAPGTRINRVSDSIKTYLRHYPSNHRPKSVTFATQRLAAVQSHLGAALLIDLTEDRIREYVETRLGEGLSGRTINMELGELSRAMGVKWSQAWPRVRKLEENHEVGQALSPEQEKALLRAAAGDNSPNRNPMLYPFLQIALTTGMRSGEITSLRWGQIDLSASVITVGRKAKTRAGSGRQIPMNPSIKAALELYVGWYAQRFGEICPEWFVFPGRTGRPAKGRKRPMDPTRPATTIKSSWEALRTKAGVSCRLHDLRHTAATKMAEAGIPESTMLAIMGHMSRAMLERYSHIRMAAKRAAVVSMALPDLSVESPISIGVPKESPKVDVSQAIQ
jgi:integrase